MRVPGPLEFVLRDAAPRVLSAVVRRHGQFDLAEDAVQEAMLAASRQWPDDGIPDSPENWLVTVADRRMIDLIRSESARRRREITEALREDVPPVAVCETDDTIALLELCCHPELPPVSQIALTLRAVGGLTTAEIARTYLVPEATMAQRISRAKRRIRAAGARFPAPTGGDRDERRAAVLHVLYLIFTEGHTASAGPSLQRLDLAEEAIRLTRQLVRADPDESEAGGLLALMLLTHARRATRTDEDGDPVPLPEQDRSRWDKPAITEGTELITSALQHGPVGPYQLQAAIAAVQDEAATADEVDWRQIGQLYALLDELAPSPVVTLNRAVAVAMVDGPAAGLELLEPLRAEDRSVRLHRLHVVRGQLLAMTGEHDQARSAYATAAKLATSLPEQRHLRRLIDQLG